MLLPGCFTTVGLNEGEDMPIIGLVLLIIFAFAFKEDVVMYGFFILIVGFLILFLVGMIMTALGLLII